LIDLDRAYSHFVTRWNPAAQRDRFPSGPVSPMVAFQRTNGDRAIVGRVQQNQFDWVRMIHVGSNREEWESGLRQQKSWPAE
jgi:hypothetical protein